METIVKNASPEAFRMGGEILRKGGLVAFPTETVYGLGGNALDPGAARKIYAAKGRPSDNPLIVHLANVEDAGKYCHTNAMFDRLAAAFMPGPITVVMQKREIVPDTVTGGLDTVAIRVPANPDARALIEAAGVPVAAPSANTSGKPSPTSAAHVIDDMRGKIDMIIDGGDCEIGLESTIVKIADGHLTLLRPGGITVEMLRGIDPDLAIDKAVLGKLAEGERPQAPGMKYRHYAPDTRVVIVDGDDEMFRNFIENQTKQGKIGALVFDDDAKLIENLPVTIVRMGEHTDAAEAHSLFAKLREIDKCGCETFYVRMPRKEGIGLAVYNRMIKAAGHEIVKL
ncbi:MAG: threonylcarbamoyl-AMP synthase [Ruminococcaceae bacterium]|nr:threonylcarbamoyl-AMP synthase [Oscillospiraceae bacterium]